MGISTGPHESQLGVDCKNNYHSKVTWSQNNNKNGTKRKILEKGVSSDIYREPVQ